MDPKRSLTRREFDEVIRRAAELAADDVETDELSEEDLYRIAGDVGLTEGHVHKALVEVRAGALQPRPSGPIDRIFGPQSVVASRVVPGSPEGLSEEIDEFLVAGQLLQTVRRSHSLLQYRPAVDWASQVARAASSTSRRYYVAAAKSVEVRLEAVDDERTLVEFEVDPATRGDHVAGSLVGGAIGGGGAGFWAAVLVASTAPMAVAVATGVLVLGAGTAASAWIGGHLHERKLRDVRAEVEGILDQLESEAGLEPPPPAWRRWVKRHFHGARRLLGDDDDPGIRR